VSDHVTLVFADGTEYAIEVKDGEADATAKAIIDRSGDYSTGWLSRDDRNLLNLGSIVRIEIRRASDPGPSVEFSANRRRVSRRRRALKQRFPNISGPHKEDICYATTNRQLAVKKVAPVVDALIVVGAPNSSNSQRLREVAEREGCPIAVLAQRAGDLDWSKFTGIKSLGITAGASAPEVIVEEIMGAFAERYELHVETVSAAEENEFFPLPRSLRPDAA